MIAFAVYREWSCGSHCPVTAIRPAIVRIRRATLPLPRSIDQSRPTPPRVYVSTLSLHPPPSRDSTGFASTAVLFGGSRVSTHRFLFVVARSHLSFDAPLL